MMWLHTQKSIKIPIILNWIEYGYHLKEEIKMKSENMWNFSVIKISAKELAFFTLQGLLQMVVNLDAFQKFSRHWSAFWKFSVCFTAFQSQKFSVHFKNFWYIVEIHSAFWKFVVVELKPYNIMFIVHRWAKTRFSQF